MLPVDLNEPITLPDGTYTCVEHNAGVMRLRSDADGQYRVMHVAEVAQQMLGVPRMPGLSPRTLETVGEVRAQRAMVLADHIAELADGVAPGRTPRPEYDPVRFSLNERIERKVDELRMTGQPASRATLMRKLKAFREEGATGLIDRRALRTYEPLAHLDTDILDALCKVIAGQVKRSTGTKSRLIRETHELLLKRHGAAAPTLPSDASMYRYIDALTAGKYSTGSAMTRRSVAGRPNTKKMSKQLESLPGAQMQVDSTKLDMFVRMPDGSISRPILTVLFDVATRMVVAHTFRMEGAKSVDHLSLLLQALVPPQNRPPKEQFRRQIQQANPHVVLATAEERRSLEATRPFIYPRMVLMDNGRDFLGDPFVAALQKFGIDVRFSPPHTPSTKAHVERNFGSINTLFVEQHGGYTGSSPDRSGREVAKETLMDLHALHEVFDDWLLKVWNHRKHDALRDRMHPHVKLTPYEKYLAEVELTSTIQFPLVRDDYIELLPTETRTIQTTGVQLNNRHYDSAELHPYRHTRSNRSDGLWEVKTDPYNPSVIWVRSPENQWIECPERDADAHLQPMLGTSRTKADTRAEVAELNALSTGVPIHNLATKPTEPSTESDDTPDDDDDDDYVMPEFDPTEG